MIKKEQIKKPLSIRNQALLKRTLKYHSIEELAEISLGVSPKTILKASQGVAVGTLTAYKLRELCTELMDYSTITGH